MSNRCCNAIFQQTWWLDAVAPGTWGEVVIKKGDAVAARMPYVMRKKLGLSFLIMPNLTQTLGPWLRPTQAKYANQLAEQKDLMTELIKGLPRFHYFHQNFHYSITNWLPFFWQGFSQTTRYTYVLEDLSDLDEVWEGLLPRIRTDIKKAKHRFGVEVISDFGLEVLLDVNEMTFRRQGISFPYSRDFMRRLDKACDKQNARKMFFACDGDGTIHSVAYIVWDELSAYYLLGGGDPEYRNSGATSLCLWEAIRFASSVTKRFDFEGSMIEPIERFFRGFGAVQKPYFSIHNSGSHPLKLYSIAQRLKLIRG